MNQGMTHRRHRPSGGDDATSTGGLEIGHGPVHKLRFEIRKFFIARYSRHAQLGRNGTGQGIEPGRINREANVGDSSRSD